MIGIVVVSHSARLAEGVCELAEQVVRGKVRMAAAGGTSDPEHPMGTDAFRVLAAIESVYSEDGVLVFTDLGSAALSAETALEFLDEGRRARVRISAAPLIEGVMEAAGNAGAGAGIEEIGVGGSMPAAARGGMGAAGIDGIGPAAERSVAVSNPLGLHARPAAQFIRIVQRYRAQVTVENLTVPSGPAAGGSLNGVLGLAARQSHVLRLRAQGSDAHEALAELAAFLETPEAAGSAGAAGIAIGPLVRWRPAGILHEARTVDDPEGERQRLLAAIRAAKDETRELYRWAQTHSGIFDAQLLFLEDPALIDAASGLVRERRCNAEFAWQEATREAMARIPAQAADLADVSARVMRRLTGVAVSRAGITQPSIVAAHDLTPSEVKAFDPALVLGVCLEAGGASAHSTILARAIGIPVVTGLGAGLAAVAEGTVVGIDGERGEMWVAPDGERRKALEARRERWLADRAAAESGRHGPAITRDGRRVRVLANISGVAEAAEAVEQGADGVGVLRTEFLFLNRAEAPGEDEQYEAYRAIARALDGRPLTIRTLDVGGDKSLPYVEIGAEANPFLGWRGIRVTLGRPDLFRTQLRAILRTAVDYPVSVLLPMVSSLEELRATRAIVEDLGLGRNVPIGVMIEVPAAVAIAGELAREASFFSIGTNDLIQYVMAADRTNPRVAHLADPLQPAVLRTIRQAVEAGRAAGIEVTVCGEMAADPRATQVLLEMGVGEFSVSVGLIAGLKAGVRRRGLGVGG